MEFRIIFLIVFTSIVNSNVALSASFNCNKSTKKVEFSICENSSLNEADTELGSVYKELRHSLSNDESIMLRNEQRLWIKLRDQACSSSDVNCLMTQITSRTQELKRKLDIKKYAESSIPEYTPSYSKKSCDMELPSLACSPEDRDAKAIAMCSIVMGGCEVVTHNLENAGQKFVTGQACNAMVSQLGGNEYDINAMLNSFVFDLLHEGAKSAMSSDNLLVNIFIGLPLTATSYTVKVQHYAQCINEASKNCSRLYNEWKSNC